MKTIFTIFTILILASIASMALPVANAQTTTSLRAQVESIRKEALGIQEENKTLQSSLDIAEAKKGEAVANLETTKANIRALEAEAITKDSKISSLGKEIEKLSVDAHKWRSLRTTFAVVCGVAVALILAYALGSMAIKGALIWGSGGGVIVAVLVNAIL